MLKLVSNHSHISLNAKTYKSSHQMLKHTGHLTTCHSSFPFQSFPSTNSHDKQVFTVHRKYVCYSKVITYLNNSQDVNPHTSFQHINPQMTVCSKPLTCGFKPFLVFLQSKWQPEDITNTVSEGRKTAAGNISAPPTIYFNKALK